jgi:hypothetical protein
MSFNIFFVNFFILCCAYVGRKILGSDLDIHIYNKIEALRNRIN